MTDVPATMRAWVIRPDRLGEPREAMRLETVETPQPGPGEVVVEVMAAGVNYNNVWACLGEPVSVFRYTGHDFHIGGSDASGIVAAVGAGVTRWKAGDEVVVHCNQSCGECPECNGLDPMACSQQRIWAYETNWGSFADYCLVQAQQLLPKPAHLTWAEAASYGLVYFTAYRMLVDQAALEAGHNVLVWGAGGGLGSMAIQLCRLYGANAIAVVSSEDKADLCRRLGAHAVINRRDYALADAAGDPDLAEVKRFGKAIRDATGGRRLRHRVRARRLGDVLHERLRLPYLRQDRDLRRDVRLLAHVRRALPLDAPEDDHRLALRECLPGLPRQPVDRATQDPASALAHVPVRAVPGAAPDDARERAPREDGRARRRRPGREA